MTITMTSILHFENVTSVPQTRDGGRNGFKHLVQQEYGQFDQNNMFDMATGAAFPNQCVVVIYIFPYRWLKFLPQFTSLNNIDDVGNSLMLYQPVAWAFNRAKLCIQVDSAGVMLFHLFDAELRDIRLASKANSLQMVAAQDDGRDTELELSMKFGDLHGQAVQFPVDSTVRPSKRLLALHAYAAWLQARSLNPGVELTVPQQNFLNDETTGQAIYFLVDLWRNNVQDGPPVS